MIKNSNNYKSTHDLKNKRRKRKIEKHTHIHVFNNLELYQQSSVVL